MDDMDRRLERLEAKLDLMSTTLGKLDTAIALLTQDSKRSESMDGRVAALERFRFWLVGVAAGAGALFSVLSHVVLK